jgi:hypothetical protein
MRHIPRAAVALVLFGAVACAGDDPTRAVAPTAGATDPRLALAQPAEPGIPALLASLLPTGLETAAIARWDAVRARVDAGQPGVARTMLAEMLTWLDQKQAEVGTLTPAICDGALCETVASTGKKVRLLMQAYVYGLPAPSLPVGADFGGALILPDGTDPLPIVTLDELAGVDLKPGSVNVPTLVTVVENQSPYGLCAGPMTTTLCQLPRYYKFDASPHVALNVPAAFAVCHTKPAGLPWATSDLDERLLLAHDLPADPANYTPGAVQFEGIEMLPYTTVAFLHCEEHTAAAYAPASPLVRGGRALLAALGSVFTPRAAWAIDLGGGGQSKFFSNFGVVDPAPPSAGSGLPDLTVENVVLSPLTVAPGGSVSVHWRVRNAPGFPNGRYVTAVLLSTDAVLTPGTDLELARGRANAGLGSNGTADHGQGIVIPVGTPPGVYYLGAFVDPDGKIAESNETNNYAAVQITVVPAVVASRVGGR